MNWTEETEKRVQRGVAYFKQGYNCSQSVALTFADRYNIPEPLMARISASFGGGIGRMRETCGAACGMFLLAGLEVTNTEGRHEELAPDINPYPDPLLKKKDYEVVQHLAAMYREQTGSLLCRELLGLNKQRADGTIPDIVISATPEARTDEYYKKRPCVRMVELAIRTYMRYLQEEVGE
ncbi:MAG: C-GCAxxG-C-C family protein [Bacteroidales bacterium]|nr:C-GCAxxG-C-C family protein [Bacteroidales bacterium]